LFHEPGRIQLHELIAFGDLDSWLDDPLDGGGAGTALGTRSDRTDNVAVLGRFQRAALDDGHLQLLTGDRPGRAAKGGLAKKFTRPRYSGRPDDDEQEANARDGPGCTILRPCPDLGVAG